MTSPSHAAVGIAIAYGVFAICHVAINADEPEKNSLDPAAWGSDHIGETVPEYMTGGECLFCHRKVIGKHWSKNRHQLTIRPVDEGLPERWKSLKPTLVLGSENLSRYLRKSSEYGKLEMTTTEKNGGDWDAQTFGNRCAGCHATGVDHETQAFSSLSIDCYSCHGDVDLDHTKDSSLMVLSKKRNDPARVAISICAQCHIRTGKSRSTGLPYANNFIAGDNLFRDFEIDFTDEALKVLNPGDGHILENVRDVVLQGNDAVTCLTCHQVHHGSTDRHQKLAKSSAICNHCHESKGGDDWTKKSYKVHSAVCGY